MSPQPSRVSKFQEVTAGDYLVFGKDPRSSLAIPKALLAELWTQVDQGTRMLARGGLEVGGLLVGPKAFGDTVVVDEIIPLPIEYRRGPCFQMSSSDLATVPPIIESVQEDQSKAVVGFYRGRTRGETTLRETDCEVLDAIEGSHTSFAPDFRCFFVLAPMSESTALACITLRDGGDWDEMQSFTLGSNPLSIIELPPSTALQPTPTNLHTEEQSIVSNSAVRLAAESRVAAPGPAPLAAGRWRAGRAGIWLYAAGCLVAMVVAAGAYRWAIRKQPRPTPSVLVETRTPRAHLGFSAAREGPVWKLSWDRAAMDALNPVGAVLIIEDGGFQQQVPLEPADLASGTLFYTPQSNELTFGLRIDRGGSHIEEHVRVLEASRLPQRLVDRVPQSVLSNTSVQSRADARGITVPNVQPPAVAASTTVSTQPVSAGPRKFVPPTTLPREPAGASTSDNPVAEPPVVVLAVPVLPSLPRRNPVLGPPPAPIGRPPVTASTALAPSRGETAPAAAIVPGASPVSSTPSTPTQIRPAAPPASSQANYVGPRPIQQVRPPAPANVPPGMSQMEVLVEIDARGKVTKAAPVGWTTANAPLMIAAVRAASSWVFAPAQLNGQAVSSQMNLIFRF